MKSLLFAAKFSNNIGQTITWRRRRVPGWGNVDDYKGHQLWGRWL